MKKLTDIIRRVSSANTGKCAFVLAACVLAAACNPVETAPLGEGQVIEIRQGTTGNFEGLRIGLSNISETDYITGVGEKRHGLEAVIVLFLKTDPPQEKRFDTHAGDTVSLGKYSVYVQQIKGGSKGSVKLQVKAAGR